MPDSTPIEAAVHNFTWAAGGIWTLVGIVIVGLIRQWVPWQKVRADRATTLDEQRSDDMTALRKRISELEARLDAKDRIFTHIIVGFQMLSAELASKEPTNAVLVRAHELVDNAMLWDGGLQDAMMKLSHVAGVTK